MLPESPLRWQHPNSCCANHGSTRRFVIGVNRTAGLSVQQTRPANFRTCPSSNRDSQRPIRYRKPYFRPAIPFSSPRSKSRTPCQRFRIARDRSLYTRKDHGYYRSLMKPPFCVQPLPWPSLAALRVRKLASGVTLVALACLTFGCSALPQPPDPVGNDGPPVVRLSVDNPAPGLSESVLLQCTLSSGSTGGLEYSFSPEVNLISINRRNGTATFIVNQTDLGLAILFSCRARNDQGTGPGSNIVTVIPTG